MRVVQSPHLCRRYLQAKEEITLPTIMSTNTPHPTLHSIAMDDIPVDGNGAIPSVVIDESGHFKLLQTKNKVHSLREILHKRSMQANDHLSQMIHNAVAPVPVVRHGPEPNPPSRFTNHSCETNDAFTGIPIDNGNLGNHQGIVPDHTMNRSKSGITSIMQQRAGSSNRPMLEVMNYVNWQRMK
jgi:hypothetical protein